MILTPFYNPHQQDIVRKVIGTHDVCVKSFGGFKNAENQRMIICPSFYEILDEDFELEVIEVVYNQQFGKLAHKDILGALMHLGVDRSKIGDIYINEDACYFICEESIADFFINTLDKITWHI